MRLDLDTEIRYPSGERAGVLRRALVDENGDVMSVVMATDDLISRDVVVPVDLLSEDPGGVTTINIDPDELGDLADFQEDEVPVIPEGWEASEDAAPGGDVFPATMYQPIVPITDVDVAPEGVSGIGNGTEIVCLDGEWGTVDEVLTDDEGNITSLVGRPYEAGEPDRIIPMDLVQSAGSDNLTLNCSLADLPTYTEVAEDVHQEPEL